MGYSFDAYLEKLELIAFFAGFPMIYAIIVLVAGSLNNPLYKNRVTSLLPYSYAFVGLLYMGYFLRNLYPDYSFSHINASVFHPLLKIWAFLSLLFWIPLFNRKTIFSLIHSLVFFFLIAKDIIAYRFLSENDPYIIKNQMKVYTDSLLLNAAAFIVILLISVTIRRLRKSH